MSDCDAVGDVQTRHRFAPTGEKAVADSIRAGCDQDCGMWTGVFGLNATKQGLLSEADVDTALARVLRIRFRLGEFDPASAVPQTRFGPSDIGTPAAQQLALSAARQALVLLNNSRGVLPLSPSKVSSLAVIGPLANATTVMMGGKSDYDPAHITSVLEGVRRRFNGTITAATSTTAAAAATTTTTTTTTTTRIVYEPGLPSVASKDTKGIAAAVRAAKAANFAVLVVGIDGTVEQEGHDRMSGVGLPGAQLELVQQVTAAVGADRVVLVLLNGGPVSLDWCRHNLPTILEAFEGGQSGGQAVAEALAGDVAPSGTLPYTILPSAYLAAKNATDMNMRPVGASPGRTYRFYRGSVLWPFGWSYPTYTTFNVQWAPGTAKALAGIKAAALAPPAKLAVRVDVTNTGSRPAAKVLQLYVRRVGASDDDAPDVSLVAYARSPVVAPGATRTVTLSLEAMSSTFCGFCATAEDGTRQVRPGKYQLSTGGSARAGDPGEISIEFDVAGEAQAVV